VLEQHQYLTFVLGGETYAIGILHIKEIIEHGQVTPMPMMPEFIRGVINLRGRAVPVIDLSARFGRAVTVVGKKTCIVILELDAGGNTRDVGVVVDAVNEVLEIPRQEIESPPELGADVATHFIEGMGKVGGRFVVILDVARILTFDELAAIERLEPTGAADGGRVPA
jgi:purine-binding chemotaxis protein CheW